MLKTLRPRGYSLVEVLVTIAVVAVLVAAVAPSASELMANMRLRSASESMLSGLQKARSEAVKSNQVVTFWMVSAATPTVLDNSCQLSSTSRSWVVSYDDPSSKCSSASSTTVAPRIVQLSNAGSGGNDLSVTAAATDGSAATQVSFDGFGRRPAAALAGDISTIDFVSQTSGTRALRIQISAAGNVKICDPHALVTVPPDPKACL